MAVITQNYDIDLKATGEFPVVKMSQFDTGSRTIVLTVYDGHELAKIDGCIARVDGTRSDGVEFSRSCAVETGSKVSFTITQEMTKTAGKHAAELVIFDASGNPIGTQNFVIDVEAAPMVRDSAVSADDRTLYDQYTDSIEQKFSGLSASLDTKADALNKSIEDISGLVGAASKPITICNERVVNTGTLNIRVRLTYDPVTALVHACANGTVITHTGDSGTYDLYQIDSKYCPNEDFFTDVVAGDNAYIISIDNLQEMITDVTPKNSYLLKYYLDDDNGTYKLRFQIDGGYPDHEGDYSVSFNATWYARGGKYMGVTPIGTGGNTVTVGMTTTGAPGTQASVTNSGTANDVVLDFTIPRGDDGAGSSYTLPVATASTLGGVKIGSGISVASDGTISASGGGSGSLTLQDLPIYNVKLGWVNGSNTWGTVDLTHFHLAMYGQVLYAWGYFDVKPTTDQTFDRSTICSFAVSGLNDHYVIATVGLTAFNGVYLPVQPVVVYFNDAGYGYIDFGSNTTISAGKYARVYVNSCTMYNK